MFLYLTQLFVGCRICWIWCACWLCRGIPSGNQYKKLRVKTRTLQQKSKQSDGSDSGAKHVNDVDAAVSTGITHVFFATRLATYQPAVMPQRTFLLQAPVSVVLKIGGLLMQVDDKGVLKVFVV